MSLVRPDNWTPQGIADLEPRAWRALRENERSSLAIAGAGAGKTEFLAQKATYLLQTGLCPAPKRILAISFKCDAARNLSERVAKRCPPEQARRFNSYTFDAFAKNLVDRFREAIPEPHRPPVDYRIVTPRREDYRASFNEHGFRHVSAQLFERAVATTRLPIAHTNSVLKDALAAYWHAQYNDYDQVLLSFPMLNRLAELLIRSNPSIVRALRLTYPVVFLDEFQDATSAQFQLLCTAFDGSDTVFTAVGDDKQRIMVWAGAMSDAFNQFKQRFGAKTISLLCNWRSHEDLVQIQHVIARRIDPTVERARARADRLVEGDAASIWQFSSQDEERDWLARWIGREVKAGHVRPHDVAILVRRYANTVEDQLAPAFEAHGLRLRNVDRTVGDIALQDLLGEGLSLMLLRLLRLGTTDRSPENWNAAMSDLQFVEAVDPTDEVGMKRLHQRLQSFVRELRERLRCVYPVSDSAAEAARSALHFIGAQALCRAFPAYRRQPDFNRVWNGFVLLLRECLEHAETWADALDRFQGLDQTAIMTIHKSKGLEFHTMIFYGLDSETWWDLTENRPEELNSFFVALTRAKQRAYFTLCTERGNPVTWIEDLLASAGVNRMVPDCARAGD